MIRICRGASTCAQMYLVDFSAYSQGELQEEGLQSPEILESVINFICAFMWTKILAVEMGKRVDMSMIMRKEM